MGWSLLFVPALNEHHVAKAAWRGALVAYIVIGQARTGRKALTDIDMESKT